MRTKHSFYNFIVSLITSVILPLVGFVKISLFIGLYGRDINGLQLTIAQIIMFLNICELAFSLAFRQLLFKPLANDDKEAVLKIYHGAKKVFNATGTIVLILGIILAFLFPFFAHSPLDYFNTVLTFIILCVPYGISYFLMGPNFVIIADQQEYKINIWIQTFAILRMGLMIFVILMKLNFYYIILIEGANILLSNFVARRIALKAYPWLKDKPKDTSDKSFQHSAKYTIIQRLSVLATSNTDNIVISMFMGYDMTSVFGNYSYLTDSVSKIINSAITSPINSFGNLFNDYRADAYNVFTEFFNFATYIASVISICIFVVMQEFLTYWMKDPAVYRVTVIMAFLFAMNIFYLTMREPIIISRDANGLFKNAKNNAYLMAISKVLLSIILIRYWGFAGVLMATFVTNWIIDFFYNPILVYKNVFSLNPLRYYKMVVSRLLLALGIGTIAYIIWNNNLAYISGGMIHFVIACLILGISVGGVMTLIYAVSYKSFRNLFVRLLGIFRRSRTAD
ncbi:lipopolysaccharide biosynthesis protein [Anaerorhabdus sp.]|uniref:lipopolysaccharide biosynthesis protein n=1 Tax=Anaerorhabdus sp. TaxID=1872524 RepID=UPI002FC6230B